MYENKMNLINNLAKNILYYFKTENNITLNNLKNYLISNNEINIDVEDLIKILESYGIIYFYNNHYNLYDKFNSAEKINKKLNKIEEIKLADLICNFNITIKNEKITNKELNKFISNYLEFNNQIKDILIYLSDNKIITEKNNNIFITIDERKEKNITKYLNQYKNIDVKNFINYLSETKITSTESFIEKIMIITNITNKINKIKDLLEYHEIVFKENNEYINLYNNKPIKYEILNNNHNLIDNIISKINELLINKQTINYEILYSYIKELIKETNIDVEDIISLLEKKGLLYESNNNYSLFPENYRIGKVLNSAKGNPYILVDDGVNVLLKRENINGALQNDTVIYSLNKNKKPYEIKIIKVLERSNQPILCEVNEKEGKKLLIPHNVKGKLNLIINKNELKNLQAGDYVLVKPDKDKIDDSFNCQIVSDKIVLTNNNISPALALIAIEHECNPDYSQEVYEEIKNIPDKVSEEDINKRINHDFRNKDIFTIDGITTKDMDDAVGIEVLPNGNYQVTVSIAEPNHYVKKGSAIYKEAKQRDFTLYMLNTAIHMFHPKLANDICSLNENEDRLTKSAIIEFDQNGIIVNSKVCKSVINSKKKMNYDDVNSILENDITPNGYEPYKNDLIQMKELTDKIWKTKEKDGLLELDIIKHEVAIDNNNNVSLVEEKRGPAQKLIEVLMIMANTEIGTILKNSPLPGMYRVHEESDKQKIYMLCDTLKELGINIDKKDIERNPRIIKKIIENAKQYNNSKVDLICNLILSTFKRAKYTTSEGMHWALNLDIYTHFTSPIRRIADFEVHEKLDELFELYNTDELIIRENYKPHKYISNISKKDYAYKKMELEEISREATRKERLYDQAENEAAKLVLLQSLKDKIGTSYNATIQAITNDYIIAKTEEGIEGIIYFDKIHGDKFELISKSKKKFVRGRNSGETYKIGNEINITICEINDFSGDIEFELNYKRQNINTRGKVMVKKPTQNK